jgi:hypothetical protein
LATQVIPIKADHLLTCIEQNRQDLWRLIWPRYQHKEDPSIQAVIFFAIKSDCGFVIPDLMPSVEHEDIELDAYLSVSAEHKNLEIVKFLLDSYEYSPFQLNNLMDQCLYDMNVSLLEMLWFHPRIDWSEYKKAPLTKSVMFAIINHNNEEAMKVILKDKSLDTKFMDDTIHTCVIFNKAGLLKLGLDDPRRSPKLSFALLSGVRAKDPLVLQLLLEYDVAEWWQLEALQPGGDLSNLRLNVAAPNLVLLDAKYHQKKRLMSSCLIL